MEENWKEYTLEGFKHYSISDLGQVSITYISSKSKKIIYRPLKGSYNRQGYKQVCLSRSPQIKGKPNSKTFFVHKLVAIMFKEHKPNGHKELVGHEDDDKSNNRANNLVLTNNRANVSKSAKNKLGFTGVNKNGKGFQSNIKIGDINVYLGTFKTPLQASEAYQNALKKIIKNDVKTYKQFKLVK